MRHADGAEVVSLIRRGTLAMLSLLWLFALGGTAIALWLLISRGIAETQATAISLEQYARRHIEVGDYVAEGLVHYLDHRGGVEGLNKDTGIHPELYRLTQRMPPGSSLAFVLPDGEVAVSNYKTPGTPINVSDRHWFRAHVQEGARNYLGSAVMSRLDGQIVFTCSKSYFAPDGRLLGVIVLGIPSQSIVGFSPSVSEMNVALVRQDGPLVAAYPITASDVDKPFPLPSKPAIGESTALGVTFGTLSITTTRNLPDLGIYALAALPLMKFLQPALLGILSGLSVLGLFTIGLLNLSRLAQRKSQQVEHALAENRILFQEVHHRVKNNLQVISSLIRMQTDRLPDEFRPVMQQTAARVRAIAMVHEQIYSGDSPSVVQLDPFMQALLEQLQASLLGGERAEITSQLEPVTVGLDQAVPVALMATEAITNAIQHGLKCGQGAITVTLRQKDGRNMLQIDDTGTGPPPESKGGLGSRIMTALARQIDGAWNLERTPDGRTAFTLDWPRYAQNA